MNANYAAQLHKPIVENLRWGILPKWLITIIQPWTMQSVNYSLAKRMQSENSKKLSDFSSNYLIDL